MPQGVSSAERQADVAPIESTIAIQHFDDTVAVVRDGLKEKQISELPGPNPYMDFQMSTILSRQFIVKSLTWSASDSDYATVPLYESKMPYDLFFEPSLFFPKKLATFSYFRAGIKFALRINGTRFHYGRLLAAWRPCRDYVPDEDFDISGVEQASTYPHIVISASTTETHELQVPFALPASALNLQRYSKAQMGSLDIWVLNGLRLVDGTTPGPLDVTLYASFVDPEVWGASNTVLSSTPPGLAPDIEPQARRLGTQYTAEQVKKSSQGVVGGIAEAVKNVSGSLISVPIIGGVAAAVNVISGAVQAVADFFGFNKPTTIEAAQPRRLVLTADLPSGSGLDNSVKLAIEPGNKVSTDPDLVLSEARDMSLTALAMIPSLLYRIDWSPTQAAGAFLCDIPVDPKTVMYCSLSTTPSVLAIERGYVNPTLCATVALPFKWWQGSMKYKIQITASMFHTGRLRIEYIPASAYATPTADYDFNAIARMIDLNGDTEVYFTVPFQHDRVWSDGLIGFLRFRVGNPLVVPNGANAPIVVNVWAAAGEDMTFAEPIARYFVNGPEYTLGNVVPVVPPPPPEDIEPQSMTRSEFRDVTFEGFHPSSKYVVDTGICMGEQITSVRTMLHRYMLVMYKSLVTATTNAWIMFPWLALGGNAPSAGGTFNRYQPTYDLTGNSYIYATPPVTELVYNYYFHMRNMFRFWRGSHRMKFLTRSLTASGNQTVTMVGKYGGVEPNECFSQVNVQDYDTIPSTFGSVLLGDATAGGALITDVAYTPIIEFEIPYYNNQVASVVNQPQFTFLTTPSFANTQAGVTVSCDRVYVSGGVPDELYIALGDDFSLGFPKGPRTSFMITQSTRRPPSYYGNDLGYGIGSVVDAHGNVPLVFTYHYSESWERGAFGSIPTTW